MMSYTVTLLAPSISFCFWRLTLIENYQSYSFELDKAVLKCVCEHCVRGHHYLGFMKREFPNISSTPLVDAIVSR